MNILDKIVADKLRQVEQSKELNPPRKMEKEERFGLPRPSFPEGIRQRKIAVIAEFKRRSPSKGDIAPDARVEEVVKSYETGGAAALSILTDNHFGGANTDLEAAFEVTRLPLLRKDFILSEYQVLEARALGASAILLIAAILDRSQVKTFTQLALSLEMDVLYEIHQERELDKYCEGIRMVGVNNRDLASFKVDTETSVRLARYLPDNALRISESGLEKPGVIWMLKQAGYNGFLAGEVFMREKDPGTRLSEFIQSTEKLM